MRKRGVPEKMIRLVKILYEGAKTIVQTRYRKTEVGFHHGSALSPVLLLIVLDTITMDVRDNDDLWEVLFADDLVIIVAMEEELQERYLVWKSSLERKGMKVNTQKTAVKVSSNEGYEELNVTSEDGTGLKQIREFKYLGSVTAEGGRTEKAVRQRVKDEWRKWREMSGITLDKKIPLKLRMKIYKSVLRPVLLHGAETWSLKKKEGILERMEMRMVRWTPGLLGRIQSENVRMYEICSIKEKAREAKIFRTRKKERRG